MTVPTIRVREIAEQIRGVTFAKADAISERQSDYVPVIRAGNIQDGNLVFADLLFVPRHRVASKQRLRPDDVVITASSGSLATIGKAARVAGSQFEGTFGAFLKVLRPSDGVHPAYFAHYFQTMQYRRTVAALAAGANINNLKNEHLDELEIRLPSFEEQRWIAAILDQADALRAKRRQVLAHLDALSQSIFHDMFGRESWPRVALGELSTTTSGGTPDRSVPDYYGGNIPWVKSGELHSGLVVNTEESITELGLRSSSAKLVPSGTVLVAMYGATAGVVGQLGVEAATNQAICAIRSGPDLEDAYLVAVLRSMTDQLLTRRAGGAQPNLSQGILRSLELPVPRLSLQQEFGHRVDRLGNQRLLAFRTLAVDDELFTSLQSRAFKGEL